jgi:hypothetical protein
MSIPAFNEFGYLPPGIYETSWLEFMKRFAINPQRRRLATGLAAALRKLGIAGCRRVLIGGSFVTSKEHPNDFDGWDESFGLVLSGASWATISLVQLFFLPPSPSQLPPFSNSTWIYAAEY